MKTTIFIGERREINILGSAGSTPRPAAYHHTEVKLSPATVHTILKKAHYCDLWVIGDVVMVGVSEAGANEETLGVIVRRLSGNGSVSPG